MEPDKATITLRLPDRDADKQHTLALEVEPGQRERVLALVRNQSGIVDNYQLRVDGLPDDWWSIFPDTVYLVPFGTGGTYEQEVEIHLHPPRTPDAEAKLWDLQVVAHSKAHEVTAAAAPLAMTIQPYTETATKVRPERAKGRRKANYDVAVENKANAPVLVALEGEDPDGELQFGFNRPPQEIPAGQTVQTVDAGAPAQADLDRPRAGEALHGEHADRRGRRGAPRRGAGLGRAAQPGARRAGQARVLPPPPRRQHPGRLRPARLQAAGLRAGPEHRSGRHQPAQAAVPRAADPGPADEGPEPRRVGRPEQARRPQGRREVGRAGRPAAALPGRLLAEGVAALVADPGRPAARRARGRALPAAAQERRGAGRRRVAVVVRGREGADRGRPRAQRDAEAEGRPRTRSRAASSARRRRPARRPRRARR